MVKTTKNIHTFNLIKMRISIKSKLVYFKSLLNDKSVSGVSSKF